MELSEEIKNKIKELQEKFIKFSNTDYIVHQCFIEGIIFKLDKKPIHKEK